jgi:hypothetical protein
MPDAHHLARSLIFAHGDKAITYAEQAAQNVIHLEMLDEMAVWQRVVDAIKEIQTTKR